MGKVTNMRRAFFNAHKFDCNLGNGDISRVTNMQGMFAYATSFKGSGFSRWNTRACSTMYATFCNAKSFKCDILSWNETKCKNTERMFEGVTTMPQKLKPKGAIG